MAVIDKSSIIIELLFKTKGNRQAKDSVKGIGSSLGRVTDFVKGDLIANGITSIANQASGLFREMGSLAIQAEQTKVSFETFLGSAELAEKVLKDLNKFSLETPFTPDAVNQAGKALLAFGIEQENLIPSLRAIGDLSAGTGKDFNELATIYGKARVQGTLFAEDINQLTEAGIPIIGEFAKQFGVAESEVKKLGSEGKISFANLEEAFQSLTGEGGKFFELTLRQSQTVGGLLSTLQGAFSTLLKNIGETFLPLAKEILPPLISGLFALVDAVKPVTNALSTGLGGAFRLIKQVAEPVIDAGQRLFAAFGEIGDKINQVIPAGNILAGTIEYISNLWTSLLNGLSRVLEFEVVQKSIAGLVGILVRIPAVFNGVLEAGKQFVSNLGNRFEVLGLQAEKLGEQLKSIVSDDAADNVEAINRRIEELREQRGGLIEAFNEGFDDVANAEFPKVEETQVKELETNYAKAGQRVGKTFATEGGKEAEKLAKKLKEESEKALRNIEDLRVSLIVDDEERQIAQAELSAKRSIEALVGSPEQIKIQSALINQVLQREILSIKQSFNKEVENLEPLPIFSASRESEARVKFLKELKETGELTVEEAKRINDEIVKLETEKEIKLLQTQLIGATDKEAKQIREKITQLRRLIPPTLNIPLAVSVDFGEDKDLLDGLPEIFNPDSEANKKLKQGIALLGQSVNNIFSAQNIDGQLKNIDRLIDKTEERISKASEDTRSGSDEIVRIETERLERLEEARAEALKRQAAQQKIQASLAATTSLIEAVPLVLSLFRGGNVFQGIAGIATVIASIAALKNAISQNTPTFHTGTTFADDIGSHKSDSQSLKQNEFMAKLEKGEIVVSKGDSAIIRKLGFKHTDIAPALVAAKNIKSPRIRKDVLRVDNASDKLDKLIQKQDEQIKAQERTIKYLKNLKTDVTIDEKGFMVRQMQIRDRARKNKRIRR